MDPKQTSLWSRLGTRERAGLAAGLLLILVAGIGLAVWSSGSDYRVLFSQLNETDAASVVDQLKRQKIPFRLADGGTTIKVPAEQVYETRLALVSSGVPLSGGVGFEIFDRQGVGATEQSQRVTYQRALQGELARTIAALNDVKYARVHLVLPESTLFKRDREEPRASVTLVVKPATSLSREEVIGIQRLVAASVAGLDPAKVVITDQRGVTLSGADETGAGAGGSEARLRVKREVEDYMARKILALLDRAYGPGQALVSVDVALNFDDIKSTIQDVVPMRGSTAADGAVVRKRQVEAGSNASQVSSSEAAAAASAHPSTATTEVEYEFGRRLEQVISAPGSITRMSIGVVVPGALDDAKRQRIADLVRVAAGINSARGDAVVVEPLDQLASMSPSQGRSVAGASVAPDTRTADGGTAAADRPVPWGRVFVLGSLGAAILLVLGVLLGRSVWRRQTALSPAERQQLLLELEGALTTGSAHSVGSEA